MRQTSQRNQWLYHPQPEKPCYCNVAIQKFTYNLRIITADSVPGSIAPERFYILAPRDKGRKGNSMTKLEKVMEALDKAIRLSRKTGRPKPPKKIPRTYEGMDERELKIIDRLAAMTVDERLRFNNYQCDIMGNMTMEEVKEHAAELDEKIDAYLGI